MGELEPPRGSSSPARLYDEGGSDRPEEVLDSVLAILLAGLARSAPADPGPGPTARRSRATSPWRSA